MLCIPDGQLRVGTHVEWNAIQWCLSYEALTTVKALPAPGIGPACSSRKVDLTRACSRRQYRSHQQVRAKEKLIIYTCRRLIPRKIKEQRAHRRNAFLLSEVHLLQDVWA